MCVRVGRKYKLPSRLPPGCFLLSTLDRDQVDIGEETGQPWRKPHTALVAPSGAKFQTMVGLLTHYHRLVGEDNEDVYNSDALLSNPDVSSFLIGTNRFQGSLDEEGLENAEAGLESELEEEERGPSKAFEEKENAGEEKNDRAWEEKGTAGEENDTAGEEVLALKVEKTVEIAGEVEVAKEEGRVEGEEMRFAKEEIAVKEKVGDLLEATRVEEGGNPTMEQENIALREENVTVELRKGVTEGEDVTAQVGNIAVVGGKEVEKVEKKKEERGSTGGEVLGVLERDSPKPPIAESEVKLLEEASKPLSSDGVAKEVKTERVKSSKGYDVKLKSNGGQRDQKSSSSRAVNVTSNQEKSSKDKMVKITKDLKSSSKAKAVGVTKQIAGTVPEDLSAIGALTAKVDPVGRDVILKSGEEVNQGRPLTAQAGGRKDNREDVKQGENRPLNSRGSKTEAAANIMKQVQEANMTEPKKKVNRSTMMAPKVPEGITVKQPTSKQLAARKQSEAAKKYLKEQARATQATEAMEEKASTKARKSSAEKRSQSKINGSGIAAAEDDQHGAPFKRARRSDEVRASPRKPELVSPKAASALARWEVTNSEFLRMKGRLINARTSKMIPMGRLRFYVRETIKEGKSLGHRRGGAEICFKDNVWN